jgi:lipopolysaccharide/colanic/teichoic acid biosynthesis glycosyltransferase
VSRRAELLVLLTSDLIALTLAHVAFRLVSAAPGGLAPADVTPLPAPVAGAALLVGWLVLFVFTGLYQERFASSRFDELFSLIKVVAAAGLLLFFVLFIDRMSASAARISLATYSGTVLFFVAAGRLSVRSVQKSLLLRGRGVHRALIVGWGDRVEEVRREAERYPAAGIRIVGAIRLSRPVLVPGLPVGHALPDEEPPTEIEAESSGDALPRGDVQLAPAGPAIADLPRLIDRLAVQDVLIALGPEDHQYLDEVLRVCDGSTVALKLVPDFYAAVGGMARTEHMYGLPLIEVLPQPMPVWERNAKRLIDIVVGAVVVAIAVPLGLLVAAVVRASSPGPVIYRQTRTGKEGKPFTMLKFRTMVDGAERETGPVWALPGDARTTRVGALLRRWRLDELPQFWNVVRGEMSLVGPRPERPFFVESLSREIPLYSRRHRVQPGITGLAQVKWRYDGNLEDVRQKLKYDLFYIENMGLGMDLKILLWTIRTALSGGGH